MRTILAVAAALALTSGALAQFPGQRWQPCDILPPAGFDHAVQLHVTVKYLPTDAMHEACYIPDRNGEILYGCWVPAHKNSPTIKHTSFVTIFLNTALTDAERECIMRHEIAELPPNNWADPFDPVDAIRNR